MNTRAHTNCTSPLYLGTTPRTCVNADNAERTSSRRAHATTPGISANGKNVDRAAADVSYDCTIATHSITGADPALLHCAGATTHLRRVALESPRARRPLHAVAFRVRCRTLTRTPNLRIKQSKPAICKHRRGDSNRQYSPIDSPVDIMNCCLPPILPRTAPSAASDESNPTQCRQAVNGSRS